MNNDKIDPVIDKYRRELMEFSKRNPKFSSEEKSTADENDSVSAVATVAENDDTTLNIDENDGLSNLRENVSRIESQNERIPTVEEGTAIRDELMFAESAEMYPPYNNGTLKVYRNIEEFIVDNPRSGFLRVQVFAGEQTFPISNANVVVKKRFDTRDNIFYEEHTDLSGIMSRITLPAPDRSLSIYPSSLQPYATYDIEVTHPSYNSVTIKNCVIFDGIETTQLVEMIPGTRTAGADSNTVNTEIYDTMNGGD